MSTKFSMDIQNFDNISRKFPIHTKSVNEIFYGQTKFRQIFVDMKNFDLIFCRHKNCTKFSVEIKKIFVLNFNE